MTRIRPLLAAAASLALLLSGCSLLTTPPSTTSTPYPSDVAPELEPFYSQVLEWTPCESGMQCTTAEAPLDWQNPSTGSIELALVRQPATGDRLGSLLVNPGGPGASGVQFVQDSIDFAVGERLQERFDVVGFDPRGVGGSTPVSCYDDPEQLDAFLYGLGESESDAEVGSDEWIAEGIDSSAEFGAQCLEYTGDELQFVDTTSAARDLDLLRGILGDEKLNYLGFSYGTLLGASFADLYPENTGRLVLDGAIDPTTTEFEVTATQAQGFESAMRAYLDQCLGGQSCPFSGSVDEAMVDVRAILDRLDASPLRHSDGRLLGSDTMFTATILPLYNADNWPRLDELYTEVQEGGTETAFLLADSYNGRNDDGTYADNSVEAFIAINCLDYPSDADPATMRAEAAELAELAPTFGPQMSYGAIGCAGWPFPPTRERVEITAAGSADILVVGTSNDPATPYVWAEALAAQLENGQLVSYEGEGHTAYNKSNSCVNDTVENYFIDGRVPDSDPRC